MNQSSSTSNNQPPSSFTNPSPFGGMARPPGGIRQAPQANQNAQVSNQAFQQLARLLPHIEDTERRSTREQILEILAKDMKFDSIQALIASKQGQGASNDGAGMGGVDVDNGLNQEPPTVLDITVHLESQVNGKYSALLQNANYKGLSKRMIQSLKSNKDSRTQLLNAQELSSIEEFLSQFTFDRPRAGGAPQVQESAGSVASAPTQASNPFAFPRSNQGPPGGQKRPAGPQSRMPQQRFAVVNMFVPPAMEYQPGAINPIENNQRETVSNQVNLVSDGAAGSTKIHLNPDHALMSNLADVGQSRSQRHNDNNQADEYQNQNSFNQEQERPSVQFSQTENSHFEEEKGSVNYVQSDSGAADFIQPSSNHQAFTDFEFFNNPPFDVSKNQVKSQSPLNYQNALSRHSSNNQSHSNARIQNNQSLNQLEERLVNDSRSNKQSSKSLTPLHQSSEEQANQNNKIVEDTHNNTTSQEYKHQFQQFVQDFPLQEEQSRGSEQVQRITLESATLVQSTLINEEEEEQQYTQLQNTQVEEAQHQNLVPHFESFSLHDNQMSQGQNLLNKNEKLSAFNKIYDPSLSSDVQLEEMNYHQRQIREEELLNQNQVPNMNQFQQIEVELDNITHDRHNTHEHFEYNERTNQSKHEDERLSFPNFPSQMDQQVERDDLKFNNQFNDQTNDQRDESPQNDFIETQQTLSASIQNQRIQALNQQDEQEQSQFERLDQSYRNYPTHGNQNQTHGNQNQTDLFNQTQAQEGSSNQLLKEEAKQIISKEKSLEKQQKNQLESGQFQGKGKSGVDKQMKEIEDINRELQTSKHNHSVVHQQNLNEAGFDSLSNFDLDQYQSQQKDFSTSRNQSVSNFNTDHRPPRPQNVMNQAQTQGRRGVQNASPLREQHQFNPSQSAHNVNQVRSNTPTMQGLMQYSTSKPPQSVASINITNLEDSEALIRAYKKKKNELDELRDVFYRIETEFFTEKQRAVLFEEENTNLKTSLAKAEKQIREMQLKESGKDSHYLQKQLQLKTQECQAYQNELLNQKQENLKLRDRLKEQLTRHRHSNSNSSLSNSHQSSQPQINQSQQAEIQEQQLTISRLNDSLSKLTSEKEDLLNQIQNIKMQNQNALNHLNERLNKETAENQRLRQQIQFAESNNSTLQSDLSKAQESLRDQIQLTQSKEFSIGQLFGRINTLETINEEQQERITLLESQLQEKQQHQAINQDLIETHPQFEIKDQIVKEQKPLSQEKTLGNFAKDVMSYFDEDLSIDAPISSGFDTKDQFESSGNPNLADYQSNIQHKEKPRQVVEQQIQSPATNTQVAQSTVKLQEDKSGQKEFEGNMKEVYGQNSNTSQHQARQQIDEGLFGLPQVKATTSNKYNFFDDDEDDKIVHKQTSIQTNHAQSNTFSLPQSSNFAQDLDKKTKQPLYPDFYIQNDINQRQNDSAQQLFQILDTNQSQPIQSSKINLQSEPKPQQSLRQPPPPQMFAPNIIQQRPQNPMIRPPGVPQNYPRPNMMNQQQRPPIQASLPLQVNQQSASANKLQPQQQITQQQKSQPQSNSNQVPQRQIPPPQNIQTPRNKYILDDEDEDQMAQPSYQNSNAAQNKQINQIHSSLFD